MTPEATSSSPASNDPMQPHQDLDAGKSLYEITDYSSELSSSRRASTSTSSLGEQHQESAFSINDTFYRDRVPKSQHWSIVWSDLMMTMFILFLTMYAYQMANEKFLVAKSPEVVGGDTTDALDIASMDQSASLPVSPVGVRHKAPLITTGTVRKVKTVEPVTGVAMTPEEEKKISRFDVINAFTLQEKQAALTAEKESKDSETDLKPQNAPALDAIYVQSKQAVNDNNLKEFAFIDPAHDSGVRITLTGDLLFDTGKAELSTKARQSLQKIANAIKESPYVINVIGHTDNIPMHSDRFMTNWELSVARASQVARFLIEEAGMNPNQFVVSGYSSYRPLKPNTTSANRATNRRVEIIISTKIPPSTRTTPESEQTNSNQ